MKALNCFACGAPIAFSIGAQKIECSYCGCEFLISGNQYAVDELSRTRQSETSDDGLSTLIHQIKDALRDCDYESTYRYANRLIESYPQSWHGYYYAAYGQFWRCTSSAIDTEEFLSRVADTIRLLTAAKGLNADNKTISQFEFELTSNICAVANRAGDSDFTGPNISHSFQLFVFALQLSPVSSVTSDAIKSYCERLIEWSYQKIKREEIRQERGLLSSVVYVEYFYYVWKFFGVSDGLPIFRRYASQIVRQSQNKAHVQFFKDCLAELEAS